MVEQNSKCSGKREDAENGDKKKVQLMGGSLTKYTAATKCSVPKLVRKIIKEVEARGLQTEGLYRLAGNARQIKIILSMFEENKSNITFPEECSIHSLTNVLKRYLRTLPEPLITFDTYEEFLNLAKDYDHQTPPDAVIKSRLKDLLKRLPKAHAATLATMVAHMGKVVDCSEENKMGIENMSTMFVMSFLRPPTEGGGTMSQQCQEDLVYQTSVVKLLLLHRDIAEEIHVGHRTSPPDKQHYFRVPFVYRDDSYNIYNVQGMRRRGLFYAHFDDGGVARQIELHPGKKPLTLKAGFDDSKMCKPSLELTRLLSMEGAEISKDSFLKAWKKYGGGLKDRYDVKLETTTEEVEDSEEEIDNNQEVLEIEMEEQQ